VPKGTQDLSKHLTEKLKASLGEPGFPVGDKPLESVLPRVGAFLASMEKTRLVGWGSSYVKSRVKTKCKVLAFKKWM
jgi:hypothetical protein